MAEEHLSTEASSNQAADADVPQSSGWREGRLKSEPTADQVRELIRSFAPDANAARVLEDHRVKKIAAHFMALVGAVIAEDANAFNEIVIEGVDMPMPVRPEEVSLAASILRYYNESALGAGIRHRWPTIATDASNTQVILCLMSGAPFNYHRH